MNKTVLSLIILALLITCTNEIAEPEYAQVRITNNDSTYSLQVHMRPIPYEDTIPIVLFEVEPLSEKSVDYDTLAHDSIPGLEYGDYEYDIIRQWSDPLIYFSGTLSVYCDKHGVYNPLTDSTGEFLWEDE